MNIGIIGTGYVGLVTGVCFASKGHKVLCADVIPEKIDLINKGQSPIFEEGLEDMLQDTLENQLLEATTDVDYVIENSDIIFICVGTPSLPDGSMNYEYVEAAARNIGKILKRQQKYKVIIVKSTCIPGTTSNHVCPIIEKESGMKVQHDFGFYFPKNGFIHNDPNSFKKAVLSDISNILSIKRESKTRFINPLNLFYKFFLENVSTYFLCQERQVIPCKACDFSAFIDPFGQVFPCTLWNKPLGNLKQNSFKDIWFSKKRLNTTQLVTENKCPNC